MFLYKFLRFLIRPVLGLLFPTKVIGKENFPKERAIVICNHYSSADSLVIASKLLKNSMNCIAKKEAFKYKIVGKLFTKIGVISVDRDSPGLDTHRKILKVLNGNDILLMFPEGVRNKEGTQELAPLKNGAGLYAIKGKADITPMLYHHKHKKFQMNYLMVGKPISLEVYYDKPNSEIKDEVTALITAKMYELRLELNNYVDNKKNRKALC